MNDRRKAAAKSAHAFFGNGPASDLSPKIRDAMAKLQELAKGRESNIADMLMAGAYRYSDFDGAPPVDVEVCWEHGECFVRFPPLDGDDGVEIMLRDMAATEDWRQHFRRIA